MNRFVYRYRDVNRVGDGAPEFYVQRRIVVKETPCFVYHIPLPWDFDKNPIIDEKLISFCMKTKGHMRARRSRKDANISAWRLDQREAMADWVVRKGWQVSRLRLALERVEALLEEAIKEGVILPQKVHDKYMTPQERVITAPDIFFAPPTPETENYCWKEY